MEGKSEMTELKEQMAEMMKMMMKMQQKNTTGNFSKTSPRAKTTPPPRQGSSSKQTTREGKGKGSETKEQQHDGQNDNMSQTEETDDENTEQPTDETNPNDDMNYRPPKDDKQPTGPQTGKETHERILAPIAGQTPNTTAPWYDPNANCDYHSGIIGHSTETCRALKHRIQDLIDSKWLEFKDTVPTITSNPLPNHGNQGINVLEQDDDMAVVEKVEDSDSQLIVNQLKGIYTINQEKDERERRIYLFKGGESIQEVVKQELFQDMKTPLKVIFKVLCQQGLVEMVEGGAYEDDVCLMHGILDHTVETCIEFKALVQRLLDSQLLVIEKKVKGSDIFVLERDQKIQDRIITRKFVPVLNIPAGTPSYTAPPRWGKSMAESKQTEEVVNLAGVGNMTRSGRVYSPVDLSKKIINASKGKEKIVETSEDRPEPEVTELFPEKMERKVSEEEACEFLRFIKQSEYQVIDQLSRTPAKGLGKYGQGMENTLVLPSNSGRAGLGYSPSNYREGASEDKKGGVAQLDTIAMVEDGQLESDLGPVYQCIPGTGLSNWTEEDVASDIYYAM
ncbi:hypothetical protein Lal_00015107 [Lupinus albus]|nr:hypothetical protein Lal_00015107 [Lupinus albus]